MRLIDADALRSDWLEKRRKKGYVYDANAMLESIDEQPTIEAEPACHWISVKDRLPDNDDDVLVVTLFRIDVAFYNRILDEWIDYIHDEHILVTHWMPLPEQPKEES